MKNGIEKLEARLLFASINNGLPVSDPAYIEADILGGGRTTNVRFGSHADVMFDYCGFLDLGAAVGNVRVISLKAQTFSTPTYVDPQTVQSTATVTLAVGNTITIIATTHIDIGSPNLDTDYQFTATTQDLSHATFFQYTDVDITAITDDCLTASGNIAQNSLGVSTVDTTERIWMTQKDGPHNSGGSLKGWGADAYDYLEQAIIAGGYLASPTGNVNTTRLPAGTFPGVGNGWGPGDITTTTAYSLASSSSDTVSTRLVVFTQSDIPLMEVTYQSQLVPDGSTQRNATIGTDFGTSFAGAVNHTFELWNRGFGELALGPAPIVQISGSSSNSFQVVRQPTTRVGGNTFSTFTIVWIPTSSGLSQATVTILSNDLTTTPYTFDIFGGSGTAIQPDPYEDDNVRQLAKTISTDGVWMQHSTHITTDVDWVVFQLTSASDVLIQTTAPIGDTRVKLFDINRVQIGYDNDSGPGVSARLLMRNLAAGIYYVRVDEFGNNATIPMYGLSVRAGIAIATEPVTLDQTTGHLQVIGNDLPDTISLSIYKTSIQVALNNQTSWYPLSEVKSIFVNGRGGDDSILVAGGASIADVRGDRGNDAITTSNGLANTIYGGDGNDTIVGGDGNEFIYGKAGDDSINGGNGNDFIDGGENNDIVYGDAGNDTLLGSSGDDTLYGGEGDDSLSGGSGDDSMLGETGNDTLNGGVGRDVLVSGAGSNQIFAVDNEVDTIYASALNDLILKDPSAFTTAVDILA